jgi:hypothetical protein
MKSAFGKSVKKGATEMKWVEIINLRSAGNSHREIVDGILAGIGEPDYSSDTHSRLREIKIYHQPLVETDLSIHICWESETGNPLRSPLAARIYAALMREGLLDYSMWAERAVREFDHENGKQS